MSSPVLYLVMRNDLPSLNPGKLAAQAAHCANACVALCKKTGDPLLKKWESQSRQVFGTTIVLGASLDFIKSLPPEAWVADDSYPCEIPREVAAELLTGTEGRRRWDVHIGSRRAVFLRREIVGAFFLADEMPARLKHLELYP